MTDPGCVDSLAVVPCLPQHLGPEDAPGSLLALGVVVWLLVEERRRRLPLSGDGHPPVDAMPWPFVSRHTGPNLAA